MAVELQMKRTLAGLAPIDAMGEEMLDPYPVGCIVKVTARKGRNNKHHDKFFALLSAIYPHQDTWPTFDTFRHAVQRACGFFTEQNGQIFDVSIAFHNMDQDEFQKLYDKALHLIQTKIIPGIDRADVETRVNEILQGRGASITA